MSTQIKSAWPSYSDEEIDAVTEVLRSGRVNAWTGEHCVKFEAEFASWAEASHAVAVANGTVALEGALKALGVGEGDEVIVTPRTFIASVSSIVSVGATPVFADVDRDSQNITAETVEAVRTEKTKAVICVHLAGWPIEMDDMAKLAGEAGLYLVEDCAQAHGARYRGRSVGAIGDIGAWSFCQDKIITTGGEGGMVTTNHKGLFEFTRSFKDHGKSWDAIFGSDQGGSSFRWVHEKFGTNWRMTEMQAVIGRIQLGKMSQWHAMRKRNAEIILDAARNIDLLRVPVVPDHIEHGWYKCYVFVRPEMIRSGWSRDRIIEEMNIRGASCFSGTCPEVYREKAFDGALFGPDKRLAVARELGETSLMFMVHPTLSEDEQEFVASVLSEVCAEATV